MRRRSAKTPPASGAGPSPSRRSSAGAASSSLKAPATGRLFARVAGDGRGEAEPDEKRAGDIALEATIEGAVLQPGADGAGEERVAAVGDHAEEREDEAEKGDLHGDMPALDLGELRQEGE